MSNSAGSPSTLWQLRPAIYEAAQNYTASETSTQPRIANQKIIGVVDAPCLGRDQGNKEEENCKLNFILL